jgi:hypothetical protein
MHISRKRFLVGMAALAGLAFGASACGSSSSSNAGPSPGGAAASGGGADCAPIVIANNHGHVLVLPRADVTAGVEKTYSIQGSATHDHQVTITTADMATLATGTQVVVTSTTTAAHSHEVTVSCPA